MLVHYFCDLDAIHVDGDKVDCHSATLSIRSSGPDRQSWAVELLSADLRNHSQTHRPMRITMIANGGHIMTGIGVPDSTFTFRGVGQLDGWAELAPAG